MLLIIVLDFNYHLMKTEPANNWLTNCLFLFTNAVSVGIISNNSKGIALNKDQNLSIRKSRG